MGDGVWLRIVDVSSALEGRTYGIAGRWTLEVTDGRGRVERSKGDAELALDANDLAALYLGGFTATALARAGRIVELRGGGLATMDRLFHTALAPWCPQEF